MGSVPEIVVDGVTGFLCDDVDDAVASSAARVALARACRERVETEFTVERMIDRYLAAYAHGARRTSAAAADAGTLRARARDWWDRPMAYTDIPAKPKSLHFE